MKLAKKIISCILAVMMTAAFIPTAIFAQDLAVTPAPGKAEFGINLGGAYSAGTTVDFNEVVSGWSDVYLTNDLHYVYNVRAWNGKRGQIAGSSSASDDKALTIYSTDNTEFHYSTVWSGTPAAGEYGANAIQLYYKSGYDWSEEATYVQEFDLKVNTPNDLFGYQGLSLWGEPISKEGVDQYNASLLLETGKIRGTDVDYPVDKWFSLKMAYTYPENTWQLWYKPDSGDENWTEITLDEPKALSESSAYYAGEAKATAIFYLGQLDTNVDNDYAGFAIDNYRVYKEIDNYEGNIISPEVSEVNIEGNSKLNFSAVAKGGSNVDFCLDGVSFKQFPSQGSADTLYTYTAEYDLSNVNPGIKHFNVVKNGAVVGEKTINIIGSRYESALRTSSGTYPTGVETFDDMASSSKNAWQWTSSYISDKVAYNGNSSSTAVRHAYFTKVTDKDGKANAAIKIDQANSIEHPADSYSYGSLGDSTGQCSCLKLFTPYNKDFSADGGILEFGFDVKVDNISNGVSILGLPLWHSNSNISGVNFPKSRLLGPNGEICGADNGEKYEAEKWMNFKFTVDYTESSTNPIWNVWKDGVKIITDKKGVNNANAWATSISSATLGLGIIQFDDYGSAKTEETEYAGAAFDNIYAKRYQAASEIADVIYTKDSVSYSAISGYIPEGADKLTVTLNSVPASGYTFENVSLTLDGTIQTLTADDFTYDSGAKTVSVKLPSANVDQQIVLSIDIIDPITSTVASKKIDASFDVYKTGLEITGFERIGDKVRASFYNGTGADVDAKLIIVGYDDNNELKCVSFASDTIDSASRNSSIARMLSAGGATKYKVMLWSTEDGITPLTEAFEKII